MRNAREDRNKKKEGNRVLTIYLKPVSNDNTQKTLEDPCQNCISIVNRRKHERIDLKRLPDTDYSWRAWKQKGKYLQG